MNASETIRQSYFDWMCKIVNCGDRYVELLNDLDSIDFYYDLPMDANRYEDGINLRYRFGREVGYDDRQIASAIDIRDCSVLEMMVALSIKCEERIMHDDDEGDRTSVWFWSMIKSLGLDDQTSDRIDHGFIGIIVKKFMNRSFRRDGKGGLFTVTDKRKDMRDLDIWYQMHAYLEEIA